MKNLIYIALLFFCSITFGQNLAKSVSYNGAWLVIKESNIPVSPADPDPPVAVTGVHPMTHDQTYVSHPNVEDGDYIGEVHTLWTDTVFNNRTGSYAWSIVGGNGAYSVQASTGMLIVADNTLVDQDYTIDVRIANGSDSDTASCEIRHLTGIEGSTLIYFDPGWTGTESGTFAQPINDISTIDNGNINDGDVVLVKRDTRYEMPNQSVGIYIGNENAEDDVYLAAYGQGAKPILSAHANTERMIQTGDWLATEGVNDGDNIIIMDIAFRSDWSNVTCRALDAEYYSGNNELHRLDVDSVVSGNGTFMLKGNINNTNPWKIWDTKVANFSESTTDTRRAFKFETAGIELENYYGPSGHQVQMMMGHYTNQIGGTFKYIYMVCSDPLLRYKPAIQVRATGIDIEWAYIKDHYTGIEFSQDHYTTVYPEPHDITVKNVWIADSRRSVDFKCQDTWLTTGLPKYYGSQYYFDNILMENVYISNSNYTALRLITPTDREIQMKNCTFRNFLVEGNTTYGLQGVAKNWYSSNRFENVRVENSIFINNGTDVYSDSIMTGVTFINNIYNSVTDVSDWTWTTNYDFSDDDPFVGSGDYSPAVGASTINAGTIIADYDADILGNDIVTIDIGPFEYGGTKFNWTNQ